MSSPYEGQITIDAKLLHALWSYGNLQTVEGVIYQPGSHQECLAIVDRMFRDRTQGSSGCAPTALEPLGWAPFHVELGWDLMSASPHKGDVEIVLDAKNIGDGWKPRPVFAIPQSAAIAAEPVAIDKTRLDYRNPVLRAIDGVRAATPPAPAPDQGGVIGALRRIAGEEFDLDIEQDDMDIGKDARECLADIKRIAIAALTVAQEAGAGDLITALEPFLTFAKNNVSDEEGGHVWRSNIHREAISTWFGPSNFGGLAYFAAALARNDRVVSQPDTSAMLTDQIDASEIAEQLYLKSGGPTDKLRQCYAALLENETAKRQTMNDEQTSTTSKEISAFVRELVKPWLDFHGHEEHFAKIIAKHTDAEIERLNAEIERFNVDIAFCREAMRHADIDLSMILPEITNSDIRKSVRKTLDTIDEARRRTHALPGEEITIGGAE